MQWRDATVGGIGTTGPRCPALTRRGGSRTSGGSGGLRRPGQPGSAGERAGRGQGRRGGIRWWWPGRGPRCRRDLIFPAFRTRGCSSQILRRMWSRRRRCAGDAGPGSPAWQARLSAGSPGCLGRRVADVRRDRAAQASSRASSQDRRGRVGGRRPAKRRRAAGGLVSLRISAISGRAYRALFGLVGVWEARVRPRVRSAAGRSVVLTAPNPIRRPDRAGPVWKQSCRPDVTIPCPAAACSTSFSQSPPRSTAAMCSPALEARAVRWSASDPESASVRM